MAEVKHKLATGLIKCYMNCTKYVGWTSFWNTIYYKNEEYLNRPTLRRHELMHIEQMNRLGKIKFSFQYFYELVTKGYHNNKFEVEARAAE